MEKYDLIIVGAGPAGIFTAVELFRRGAHKKILMVEKGQSVEKRSCPKSKTQKCVNCQPCNITTGFSGAGAFSDGKLSLNHEVGGDFPNLVGPDFAQSLIDYTDQIYLEFGADPHVEGVSDPDKIRIIRRRAIRAGLKLVDCPIRHLGTEKAQELYLALENDLRAKGVDMLFGHSCVDLVLDGPLCKGVIVEPTRGGTRETIYADDVVIAAGRRGAEWLESLKGKFNSNVGNIRLINITGRLTSEPGVIIDFRTTRLRGVRDPQADDDAELLFSEITPAFRRELKRFEPFGPGNAAPIFATRSVSNRGDAKLVGAECEHLRMDLTQRQKPNTTLQCIAFQQPEHFEWIRSGRPVDVCYQIVENHYRGTVSTQLRIKDIKRVEK